MARNASSETADASHRSAITSRRLGDRGLRDASALALSILTFELILHQWLVARLGTPITYAARYALVLALVGFALRHRQVRTWSISLTGALVLVAALSMSWSPNVGAALRVVLDLAFVLAGGAAGAMAVSHPGAVIAVARGTGAAVVAHLLGLIFLADSRVSIHGDRAWSGLLINENDFGRQMVFIAIVAAAASFVTRRYLVLVVTAVFLALMSGSAQVVVVGAGVMVATVVVAKTPGSWLRSRRNQLLMVLSGAVLGLIVVMSWGTILGLLGKDATLSLRVPLWRGVIDLFFDRWWSGYGSGNVWGNPSIAEQLYESADFVPAQAHSSFLEAGMQWGAVGVLLLTAFVVMSLAVGSRALRRSRSLGVAVFGLSAAVFLYSLAASVIGRAPVEVYWFLLLLFVIQAEQRLDVEHAAIAPEKRGE